MLKKGRLAFASTFLLLVAMVLAACDSGTGNTATPTPAPNKCGSDTYCYTKPDHTGGTILISDWQFPTSTNPWFNTSVVGTELSDALYGGPFVVTSDGKFLPDELTEIPTTDNGDVSADGLTVTLKFNHNLKWSDGMPLTCSDFKYWIDVLLDPAAGAASQAGFTSDTLASYTCSDTYTMVLKYVHVFASFLFFLPGAAPQHAWGKIADKDLQNTPSVNLTPTITSGPYVVSDYASGQSFTLTPNKYYTSTSLHAPVLDKLIFKGYATKDALIAGYQAGETDHAEDFTLADLQKLQNLPGLHVSPAIAYEHVDFNLTNKVFTLNVRKAIEQAIDRCGLIQSLLHEACDKLAVDQLEPPPHPDSDPTIKEFPFDVNAAKADLQADGWTISGGVAMKDGQPFPTLNLVTTSGNQLRTNATQLIQKDLAAIGIKVNLDGQYYPAGVLFGDYASGGILATGKYDLALFAYVEGLDSYGNLFGSFDSSQIPTAANPAGGNYERVNDPMVDQLLSTGNMTIDATKRSDIYKQLQKYLVTQVYTIPLYLRPNITLNDNKLGNYFDNPTSQGNMWNDGEWYVKAAQ
jgi:peptide/nickel transport system substrate-binding protein